MAVKDKFVLEISAQLKKDGNQLVNDLEKTIGEIEKNTKLDLGVDEKKVNEWLDFILECRSGGSIYNSYDMIIGGIADDRVYNTMELYEDNLISKEEALKRLKYYKPNNQICIVNQDIIDKELKYIESKEV